MIDLRQEKHDQYMRLVGQLSAVSDTLKAARSLLLPSDKRTAELMHIAEATTNTAVLAAWEFADSVRLQP